MMSTAGTTQPPGFRVRINRGFRRLLDRPALWFLKFWAFLALGSRPRRAILGCLPSMCICYCAYNVGSMHRCILAIQFPIQVDSELEH